MEQAGQWPSSVAIDTHALIGLGQGVDIINRLSRDLKKETDYGLIIIFLTYKREI